IRITFKRQSGPPAPPKVEANSPVLRQTPPGSCADITTADGFSEMVRFSDPEGNGCMAEMVSTCQSQDKGQNDDPKWIVLTKPVDVTIDVWGGKGGNTASHGTTYHGGNGGYVRYQGQISGTINGWVGCAGGDGKDGDGSFGGGGGGASSLVTATSFTTNGWAS
ncbi:MAG: hypothetical protein WCP28_20435, partial [Actinomycetes bacterium]